jgi:hypothetical protein
LTRIGIAGIAIESSTFSPHRTTVDDFRVTRGDDLLARYAFLDDDIEWVPLLHAVSLPGGAVTEETYAALSEEIYARLRECGPLDGLFFDIHGAMSVLSRVDVEADLIEGIRAVIGPDVLVSASMDLHGNVSHRLARALDLITCYRKAPHTDAWDTRERAVRNLVKRLRHGGKPLKAWVQVPVLLPGEKTSTRIEPARSVYALVDEVEALPGVLDAAIWVGYAWPAPTGTPGTTSLLSPRREVCRNASRKRLPARHGRFSSATPATTRPPAAPATPHGASTSCCRCRKSLPAPRSMPRSSTPPPRPPPYEPGSARRCRCPSVATSTPVPVVRCPWMPSWKRSTPTTRSPGRQWCWRCRA